MAQIDDEEVISMLLVRHGSSMGTALRILMALLLALIFVAASIMNTLFLVIYWRRSKLRSISNKFIVSLTVVNLLAAWVLLPLVVGDAFLQAWETPLLCTAVDATTEFIISASIFTTLMIALDRFCAITKPLHYQMMINHHRSMMMICGSWILALIMAVCVLFGHHTGSGHLRKVCSREDNVEYPRHTSSWSYYSIFVIINMIFSFLIPMVIICWMYLAIYRAAEQNSEKTRRSSLDMVVHGRLSRVPSRSSSTRSTSSQLVNNIRHRLSNASMFLHKEESRAAKISVVVVVLFFISWFPYYLTELLESELIQIVVPADVHNMVLVLALSNAAISPYMYLYRSKRFQREVRRFMGLNIKSTFENQRFGLPAKKLLLDKIAFPSNISDENLDTVVKETVSYMHPKRKIGTVVPPATFVNRMVPIRGFGLEPWRSQNFTLSRSNSTTTISSTTSSVCTITSDAIDYTTMEKDECLQPLTQEIV
ncbi:unnamed protein product [Meganyctiphanes norvegica]|uniref:G-protein coupled receptors family 1 profile domain-containing protein n=1 Tax=Meganyctiphanes norvegica TaxID=48144 RepID=A0AAV2Q0Q1_MEGNR